jgi:maleate isomerase
MTGQGATATGKRHLLGVLTPSSNTVLEPVTSAILSGLPDASAHFARFTVTRIALSEGALAQFDPAPMLAAARQLADARVGVICWSGTAASWLGFDRDRELCDQITAETGIAACTSVLALNELLDSTPNRRFGLVSPYTDDVQEQIIGNYARAGYEVVAEAHAGISDNFAFSEIGEEAVMGMCRSVARAGAESIVIMCTNMRGAGLADAVQEELGIPLFDSAAAVVWKALHCLKADPARVTGWGSLFRYPERTCPVATP